MGIGGRCGYWRALWVLEAIPCGSDDVLLRPTHIYACTDAMRTNLAGRLLRGGPSDALAALTRPLMLRGGGWWWPAAAARRGGDFICPSSVPRGSDDACPAAAAPPCCGGNAFCGGDACWGAAVAKLWCMGASDAAVPCCGAAAGLSVSSW